MKTETKTIESIAIGDNFNGNNNKILYANISLNRPAKQPKIKHESEYVEIIEKQNKYIKFLLKILKQ